YCNRIALIDRGRLVALDSPHALKQRSLGGFLLLIECSPIGVAIATLPKAPGVREVAVFGNSLHVLVDDADAAIAALPPLLSGHGVKTERIGCIAPTIEDIFVRLVGGVMPESL